MTGYTLSSNRRAVVAAVLLAAVACERTEERDPVPTSIAVDITSPDDLGSASNRLDFDARDVTVSLTALDDLGGIDTSFDATVNVQVHYLGSLTPTGLTVEMSGGMGSASLTLPRTLGATFLWIEDSIPDDENDVATFATGTSDTLWYRDPVLEDVSIVDFDRPATWLEDSLYEGKQVRVDASKHGASGRLVVTGIYTQGYTLSDVDCSVSPCVADPFNHVFVFSFNRPRDEEFRAIEIGHQVEWVSGGIGEFNGLTELNFPQTALVEDENGDPVAPDESLLPEPAVIQSSWLTGAQSPTGMLKLEEVESGLAAVENGVLCPLDDDYETYSQWKLDLGLGCGVPINVISAGTVSDFDPADYPAGTVFSRIVGTVRAVNIGSFHVWILQPRRSSDITQ